MSTEARCHYCGKLLGENLDDCQIQVNSVAAQAEPGSLRFTVKCPRCGKLNFIKFELND